VKHRSRGAAPPRLKRRAPFLVAHRAGNDLSRLREAARLGAALVEADVRLCRGRIEVRHLKTVGPLPILWDRWRLANPFASRLQLAELLAAAPATELLLDLKGRNGRLASAVLELIRPRLASRRLTVCSRSWHMLEPFAGVPGVSLVHSVGSRRQLRALRRLSAARPLHGVSIHERLLDRATVRDLRARADLVMTWPVTTLERARELAAWGVDGLISENLELARPLHERRA
jgi:glycerophosphoryl diester phosphodiesterase